MSTSTNGTSPVTSPASPIVEVRGLSKSYGTLKALDDVTLDIQAGEIFGLLGPNGAGKTTLIGIVSGLVKRTSGEVRVGGLDVDKDYLATRRLIGLVPQEVNFDPFFNVEELLRFQAGYFGVRLTEERLVELLGALRLSDKRKANSRTLSGGMKRRLLIAKALVHEPKVLFLDEPTAGVDVELRRDLLDYVRTLRARGTTVVLTTHYLEEAEALADRIAVIDKGKLQLVERTEALMARLGLRTLTVRLGEVIAKLPESLGNSGARLADGGASIVFTDPAGADLGPRLHAIADAGLKVRDVDVTRSKLEDVFVSLVQAGGAR